MCRKEVVNGGTVRLVSLFMEKIMVGEGFWRGRDERWKEIGMKFVCGVLWI